MCRVCEFRLFGVVAFAVFGMSSRGLSNYLDSFFLQVPYCSDCIIHLKTPKKYQAL